MREKIRKKLFARSTQLLQNYIKRENDFLHSQNTYLLQILWRLTSRRLRRQIACLEIIMKDLYEMKLLLLKIWVQCEKIWVLKTFIFGKERISDIVYFLNNVKKNHGFFSWNYVLYRIQQAFVSKQTTKQITKDHLLVVDFQMWISSRYLLNEGSQISK